MPDFAYTVTTDKPFDEVVAALEAASQAHGFRVLAVHDVQETLAGKGFQREPLKIIEVCNAQYAYQVLEADISVALMLPCPITVYTQEGRVFVSTMRPSVIADFYPEADLAGVAQEVEEHILAIIGEAR